MPCARTLLLAGLSATMTSVCAPAAGADFVFGEDFEGVPACGTGFVVQATPQERSTSLGTQSRFFVKTRDCGSGGTVTLSAVSAPDPLDITFDPPSATLAAGAVGVALMTIVVPTNGEAGAEVLDVRAQNGADTAHAPLVFFSIANEVLIHFAPDGTGAGAHAFPASLTIKAGAKIRLINDDTTSVHRIHGDGVISHQAFDMTAGQEYDVTPAQGAGDFLCHDHVLAGQTQVTVQ